MTQARVRDAQPGMYRDETVRCLYLRSSETGAKTFRWSGWGKADRQPMNVSLGSWPALTVDAARIAAKLVDARNAAGESLRKQKAAPVVEEEGELTLDAVVALCTAKLRREKVRTPMWLEDAVRLSFADWRDRPLSAITPRALETRINKVHDERGAGAARTAMKAVRAIYSAATDRMGYTGSNPSKAFNVAKQAPRQRILDADEKAAFLAALDAEASPHLKPFFLLLMKTGCRRGNLESMEWGEADFVTRWWTIPADKSKSGKVMKVRLHPDAVAILKALKAAPGAHPQWVFESPVVPDAHLGDTWLQFRRIAKAAGFDLEGPGKVTPHDLRRSFGSDLMAAGVPLAVVSKALGHSSLQTTLRHYVVAGDALVGSEVDRVAL